MAAAAITPHLSPGETLLLAESADAAGIISEVGFLFGLGLIFAALTGIGIFSLIQERRAAPPIEPRGLPSIIVLTLFALFSALMLYVAGTQILSASSTSYGLTDRRVLVVRTFPFATADSYAPRDFLRMAAWEDQARLDFAYVGPRKGSDYRGRLHVRDPQAWEQRIRDAFDIETPPETPD